MFRVELTEAAEKGLRRIPARDQAALLARLERLGRWPQHNCDVVPLKGSPPGSFRLRVGSYRAVLAVLDAEELIVVVRIGHRSTVYR